MVIFSKRLLLSFAVALSLPTLVTGQTNPLAARFNDPMRQMVWLRSVDSEPPSLSKPSTLRGAPRRPEISPASEGRRSRGGAFLRSLVLPGWGQKYAESRKASYFFFVSEVLLWSGYVSQQVYGGWLRDESRVFAAEHAGVNVTDKPKAYFVDVGNYISLDAYNNEQLRRRSVAGLYPRDAEYAWEWESDAERSEYRDLRVRGEQAFNRASFFIGGVFANHLISAVHSIWAVHRYNGRSASSDTEIRLGVETRASDRSVILHVWRGF